MPDQNDPGFQNPMAQALQSSPNFIPTDNPGYITPEQYGMLRSLAAKNLDPANQTQAKSFAGVLGNMVQAWAGTQQMERANQLQQQALARAQQEQSGIGQGGGGGMLGSAPPNAGGGGGDPISVLGASIAKTESGGAANPYTIIGRKNKNGDRPYGKYQVMGNNVGPWTQEILGQPLTIEQFRASPQAQEAVYHGKMTQFYQKTGSLQDAASMWFSGKTLGQAVAGGNRPDVNGMTPTAYVTRTAGGGGGGGGQQFAQASPVTGMRPQQYGAIMADPNIPQETRNRYQEMQIPQTRVGATGQLVPFTPGQATGQEVAPGILQGSVATPNATVPVAQPTIGGRPQGQGPFNENQPTNATVRGAAEMGNEAGEIANDMKAINEAKEALPQANQRLGQIQSFRALGQDVESGALPIWRTLAARFGLQTPNDPKLGREQAYQAMAERILGGRDDSFKASIPGLSTTPEGRQYIADYLEQTARYDQQLGHIAAFGKGTATQRRQQMLSIPAPQSYFPQNAAPPAQGGAPPPPNTPVNPNVAPPPPGSAAAAPVRGGSHETAGNAPARIANKAAYDALPSGKQYLAPDGSVRTKK